MEDQDKTTHAKTVSKRKRGRRSPKANPVETLALSEAKVSTVSVVAKPLSTSNVPDAPAQQGLGVPPSKADSSHLTVDGSQASPTVDEQGFTSQPEVMAVSPAEGTNAVEAAPADGAETKDPILEPVTKSDHAAQKGDRKTMSSSTNLEKAMEIARNRAYWAAGLSLVPVPAFDVLAITGVQLKMISEIAEVYGTRLSDNLAKSILAALLSGIGATAAAYGALGYAMKSVPLVGPLLHLATRPGAAGAVTYGVGAVFAAAFEEKNPMLLDGTSPESKAQLDSAMASSPA